MAGEDEDRDRRTEQSMRGSRLGRKRGVQPEPNLWVLSGGGLELAAGVGAMCLLGWWLDDWLGTRPWLLVTGACLGFIGGLYNLWKQVRRYL